MINWGQVAVAANNSTSPNYYISTTPVTTNPSNSSFYVYVIHRQAVTGKTPVVTDNKGNTYVAVDSTFADGGYYTITQYLCQNGVGGAGHVLTATNVDHDVGTMSSVGGTTTITDTTKSWAVNRWANFSCFNTNPARNNTADVSSNTSDVLTFTAIPTGSTAGDGYILGCMIITAVMIEITGGSLTSVQGPVNHHAGFIGSPTQPGSITLGSIPYGALIITAYSTEQFATITFAESTGTTILYSSGAGTAYPTQCIFAIAAEVVTSAGAYNPSWTGGGSTYNSASVAAFYGAASTGGEIPQLMTMGAG